MFVSILARAVLVAASALALNAQAAGPAFNSERVLVVDRDTGKTLYAKAADAAAPIASVTKLMTAIVLLDSKANLNQTIEITAEDVDTLKFSSSRLPVGTKLSRRDALHLTLMSSENRAAHALARTSPMGRDAFVAQMNAKARALGMKDARFADPTGLSPRNQASALDLHKLMEAASRYAPIRAFTQDTGAQLKVAGGPKLQYRNSNPVVGRKGWDVLLSKTGFIREAGRVVVVGFKAAGRNLAVVLMGAESTAARTQDLVKVRNWVASAGQPRIGAGSRAKAAPKRVVAKARSKVRRAARR